ncbi:MAG: UxaA family hydrolase [Candidatus Thorarchaeota archaeon]
MKNKFIIMNIDDNCATALEVISKDDEIEINGNRIKIGQSIDMGHKFALKDIKKGDLIKKYGEIIGIAIEDIKVGEWIHTHNITSHYLERIKND